MVLWTLGNQRKSESILWFSNAFLSIRPSVPYHQMTQVYISKAVGAEDAELTSCKSWEFVMFWKPIIFQNFCAMSFKNHWLTSYRNIYSNISFPKAVNKTCPCGVTIFTSHHKVITSSRSLQTRLLHQGVSRLLRHDDVGQLQNVSKSADFRCEKMHFCSSESRESRIFGISALKTTVLKNKT